MFIAIVVQHTPLWVWGLLSALIVLGLLQARTRDMSLTRLTVLPLVLLALSLTGVFSAFHGLPIAMAGWIAGVTAALTLGRRVVTVRGAAWSATTQRLRVPGSWLPLVLMVGLFMVKYVAGASVALHPSLSADTLFAGVCSFAYGTFSGLFLARNLSLRSIVVGSPRLQAA